MGECPGRQGRGIVSEGEFGEDVVGRIGVGAGGGQKVERRHWHAALKSLTQFMAVRYASSLSSQTRRRGQACSLLRSVEDKALECAELARIGFRDLTSQGADLFILDT